MEGIWRMRWYNPSLGSFEWREVPGNDAGAFSPLDGYPGVQHLAGNRKNLDGVGAESRPSVCQDHRQMRQQGKQDLRKQLRKAERRLAILKRQNAALRARLARRNIGEPDGSIDAENIVWVFGSGRTGSSWLTFMMGALSEHTRWNEPLIGHLFGELYYRRVWPRLGKNHFILADDYKQSWLNSVRTLVLDGAASRFPERVEGGYLVIKEPHGSIGAPLLMEALPESRMIFLVRDPRDVVASALRVSFVPKMGRNQSQRLKKVQEQPETFVSARANQYLWDVNQSKQAFDAHEGRKVLVRYEDLRVDTFGTMRHIYAALEIPVDKDELARVVEKYAWENIPEEEKGEGTIRRKATPGGWSEDLTPQQVKIVEKEAAKVLEQFYP